MCVVDRGGRKRRGEEEDRGTAAAREINLKEGAWG